MRTPAHQRSERQGFSLAALTAVSVRRYASLVQCYGLTRLYLVVRQSESENRAMTFPRTQKIVNIKHPAAFLGGCPNELDNPSAARQDTPSVLSTHTPQSKSRPRDRLQISYTHSCKLRSSRSSSREIFIRMWLGQHKNKRIVHADASLQQWLIRSEDTTSRSRMPI